MEGSASPRSFEYILSYACWAVDSLDTFAGNLFPFDALEHIGGLSDALFRSTAFPFQVRQDQFRSSIRGVVDSAG